MIRGKGGAAATALAAFLLVLAGCGEPVTMYQVPGDRVAVGQRVLVMPFMDTRTFVDSGDVYKDTLGEHARDLFVDALRNHQGGADMAVLTPVMPKQDRSLTNAEVAELGRQHGVEVVVAGQIFSFTDTRAASIPPRAGMFIRVVSAEDGALLFVGDDYQAASVPGAGGGRDLQARNVSSRLVDGLLKKTAVAVVDKIASSQALASLAPTGAKARSANRSGSGQVREIDPLPEPPPLPGFDSAPIMPDWDGTQLPEVPPIVSVPDSFYELPSKAAEPEMPTPLPPPILDVAVEPAPTPEPEATVAAVEERAEEPEPVAERSDEWEEMESLARLAEMADTAEEDADVAEAATENTADAVSERLVEESRDILDASFAARMTGDQLAADLFASDGDLWKDAGTVTLVAEATIPAPEYEAAFETATTETAPVLEVDPVEPTAALLGLPYEATPVPVDATEEPWEAAVVVDDGPVFSTPLVAEQPRTYKLVDMVELGDDPEAAKIDFAAEVTRSPDSTAPGALRVLILPYHDRENENNLIPHTGGGEVVTSLYGTQLAMDPNLQILWDASGHATHDRLLDKGEAIRMGQMVNADYVVRGQVVEFRRAQSVPSFYSVVISTAVLAAQVFFAEFSGVDVATEVYRVSDGACVMSRRDRAQQKYVVQAEKTVRKLAAGMASSVAKAIRSENPEIMDPLIDELSPLTVLTNPR